jgi:hypothetical protein
LNSGEIASNSSNAPPQMKHQTCDALNKKHISNQMLHDPAHEWTAKSRGNITFKGSEDAQCPADGTGMLLN